MNPKNVIMRKNNMRISRFFHVISDNEIWDALNKKIIPLDTELIKYIEDNKFNENIDIIPKTLIDYGIIVDEKEELNKIQLLIEQTTDKQFQSLFLITTTSCNLDCDYCFYRSSLSESLKHH